MSLGACVPAARCSQVRGPYCGQRVAFFTPCSAPALPRVKEEHNCVRVSAIALGRTSRRFAMDAPCVKLLYAGFRAGTIDVPKQARKHTATVAAAGTWSAWRRPCRQRCGTRAQSRWAGGWCSTGRGWAR